MPAFEGLQVIRRYVELHPTKDIDEIVHMIEVVESDVNAFDLEASQYLHDIVPDESLNLTTVCFYQQCIECTILHKLPGWAKLMTLGRSKFVRKLSVDDQSIFRQADLMITPPSDAIISWWDNLTGQVRVARDAEKMAQARAAEKLSINYEKKRLMKIGVERNPEWVAIEDNTAGYDILSFDPHPQGLRNKLVEVKSTVASPLRFFISRNEWEKAVEFGEAYNFHIWDMSKCPEVLYVRSVSEIALHIPHDNYKGKWTTAAIPVG